MAAAILKEPIHYMVCVGCTSILNRKLITSCPVCHAYAFDYREEAVVYIATKLGAQQGDSSLPY